MLGILEPLQSVQLFNILRQYGILRSAGSLVAAFGCFRGFVGACFTHKYACCSVLVCTSDTALCRSLMHAKDVCGSPFGQTPTCYPEDTAYQVIDDDYCASAFASVYNVPEDDADILPNLARINADLHADCGNIHVQVCLHAAAGGCAAAHHRWAIAPQHIEQFRIVLSISKVLTQK